MQKLRVNQHFSNIQLELLKLYSTDIQENDLYEIKHYLANYFAQKAVKEADTIWERKKFDNNQMDEWLDAE